MKKLLLVLLLLLPVPAGAGIITPSGGGGGATTCGGLSDSGTGCTTTVGTSATVNTGTSGATIPLLNGANSWSALNTYLDGFLNDGGTTQVGSTSITAIGTPTAPAIVSGFTGGTTDYYFCVAGDVNYTITGPGTTAPSLGTGTTGTTGTMSCGGQTGAIKYALLRTASSTVPSGSASTLVGTCTTTSGTACNISDAANALTSFVANNADVTGIINSTIPLTTVLFAQTPYTILSTDQRILCTTSGGAITLNLPASTGGQRSIGVISDSTAHLCTVTRAGSDTINAATTWSVNGVASLVTFLDYASGKWAANPGYIGTLVMSGGLSTANISSDGSNRLTTPAILASGAILAQTNAIQTTTGSINSTTGAIGPTGGGVLQSYGGTVPTCACTGGSPTCVVLAPTTCTGSGTPYACCTGSGAGATCPISSNTAGEIEMSGATAATTCTLTFSASGAFNLFPTCEFTDSNANIAPLAYSTGAVSTTTAVVDFASATANVINYLCIGH